MTSIFLDFYKFLLVKIDQLPVTPRSGLKVIHRERKKDKPGCDRVQLEVTDFELAFGALCVCVSLKKYVPPNHFSPKKTWSPQKLRLSKIYFCPEQILVPIEHKKWFGTNLFLHESNIGYRRNRHNCHNRQNHHNCRILLEFSDFH